MTIQAKQKDTNTVGALNIIDSSEKEAACDHRIDYELLQWIFIIFFTLITVIDRFTINLWPLWVDSPGPTIPGNFSVSCFSLISWISSRMLLVSSSYIFLFQCRIFWNWFVEQKIINKYIKIGDIMQSNIKIHYHVGWAFIGIPVLLHVWAICFAAAFPMNDVFVYNSWMRPDDPTTGKSIPFYADNLLSLGINDVYRICSTSLSFFILFPYSIINCCRDHNWSFAQWIHLLAATIYTVDLIRMYSHPHCWFFNCPFIAWWIIDRLYGIFWYRRCIACIVGKIRLDEKYVILYLRIPEKLHLLHNIGDVFYFNHLKCGWDRSHPFTVFQNHQRVNKMINENQHLLQNWGGHKFSIYSKYNDDEDESLYIMSRQSSRQNSVKNDDAANNDDDDVAGIIIDNDDDAKQENKEKINYDWNVGIIMQIFPNHEDCYHRKTWTSSIYSLNTRYLPALRCWGPYRSEYRMLMKDEENVKFPLTPIVLIGTGAGCSFLVDFHNYIKTKNINLDESVYFYFSTRSVSMFQWFTDITCHKHINNLFVNAHLTSNDNIIYNKKYENKSRDSNIGRLSFYEILENAKSNTNVFFCGAPNVQDMVRKICKKKSLIFHAGHSFY